MAKRFCLYGIMASVCIVLGYLEHLLALDFIAPGIKLGLSNSVVLLLVAKGDIKGAFSVNIVRIILSALLFSSPSTLFFSLTAGVVSTLVMFLASKINIFSIIGFSVAGATVHNITQTACAYLILGNGVLYYLPLLLVSAVVSGLLIGIIANTIIGKIRF